MPPNPLPLLVISERKANPKSALLGCRTGLEDSLGLGHWSEAHKLNVLKLSGSRVARQVYALYSKYWLQIVVGITHFYH